MALTQDANKTENSSSSSGSTCSSASFAPPRKKNVSIRLKTSSSPSDHPSDVNVQDKTNHKSAFKEMNDSTRGSVGPDEGKVDSTPTEPIKKHRPLTIRIGLSGSKREAKRKMEVEMKLKNQFVPESDPSSVEPCKKKVKLSEVGEDELHKMDDALDSNGIDEETLAREVVVASGGSGSHDLLHNSSEENDPKIAQDYGNIRMSHDSAITNTVAKDSSVNSLSHEDPVSDGVHKKDIPVEIEAKKVSPSLKMEA